MNSGYIFKIRNHATGKEREGVEVGKEQLRKIERSLIAVDKSNLVHREKMLDYRHWAFELLKIGNKQAKLAQDLERQLNEQIEIGYNFEREVHELEQQCRELSGRVSELEKELDEVINQGMRMAYQNVCYRDEIKRAINTLQHASDKKNKRDTIGVLRDILKGD